VLREATPLQLVLARALMTGVALTLALALAGRAGRILEEFRARPWRIVGLGALSFFASSGLSMTGLALLPASVNSLLANTSPLMLACGVVLFERRLPSARVLVGLLLGFAGVALLSVRGAADLGAIGLVGVLLSLGGSLTWAIYTGWSRRELQHGDALAITAGAAFVGALPFLLVGAATGQLQGYAELSSTALLLLLYAGVIGTGLTYSLWMSALKGLSATNVSAFQYVIPLTAVTIAALFLGEPITLALVVGGAAILLGVGLAQEKPR
jgi:drug/metabolite transporter (DMT)-like permease